MKPTFLWIMTNGAMLSLAQRVKAEGYPVRIWISSKAIKASGKTGDGILDKDEITKDFWEIVCNHKPEELIIIVDDNGLGYQIDVLRKLGYKVVGGGSWVEKLEYERSFGNDIAEKIGLKIPQSFDFTSLSLARAFVQRQDEDKKFVFKAEGEEFAGSSKTYTAKNREDLLSYINWLVVDTKEKHYHFDKFEIQEFIDGKEADFSAYFNGEKFVDGSVCLSFEQKKVGDSEYKVGVGQASGCMGQVLFFIEKSKYFNTYLKKLEPLLKEAKYVGQIAINNIVSEKDGQCYFLEFTPRFGYDSIISEMSIRQEAGQSIAEFFINLVEKKPIQFKYDLISIGVRIYCCSPGTEDKEVVGRFFNFPKEIEPNIWLYSASREGEVYIVENGVLLVTTSVKDTLSKATKDIYTNIIDKINLSDIYFRSQIGKGVPETVKFLKQKEWL